MWKKELKLIDWDKFMETALLKQAEWWGMKEMQYKVVKHAQDSGLSALASIVIDMGGDPEESVMRMWKGGSFRLN